MKVVALISGGKDSCYAMYLAQQHGHEVVALANLLPSPDQPDELNSYMYQTVGHQLVEAYATCTGLPLFRKHIQGTSALQGMQYTRTEGDEVEDLYCLLSYVKEAIPMVGAVTCGAIASDYQRLRVENVCARLNLVSLSYLWHQPQRKLLRGMIESGLHAIIVKVAALGLDPHKHLGKSLAQLEPHLLKLNTMYGSHVCGEGGEYESLTLDCALFQHARIVLDGSQIVTESDDVVAPVAYLKPTSFHLEAKQPPGTPASTNPSAGTTPKAGDHLAVNPLTAQGMPGGRQLLLPSVSVHVVPEQYTPSHSTSDKNQCRSAMVPVSYTTHVRVREEVDYIQVTSWATRSANHYALSSDLTENDTACALTEVLEAVQQHLVSRGLHLSQALYVHLLLANMGHFAAANGVYCRVLPPVDPPSRACFQLPLPHDTPLMLDVLLARHAARPQAAAASQDATHEQLVAGGQQEGSGGGDGAGGAPTARGGAEHKKVLHVQSISSWAPCCIGPYSQATAYKGLVHLAGTIPLHAPSMTLAGGDACAQVSVALAHAQAVATAMRTCCMRAALGMVVLYCHSIGPAGKEQLQQEMHRLLSEGATSPRQARHQQFHGPPGGGDLGPLDVSDDDDENDSHGGFYPGQHDDDDDEEEEEEDAGLDPYLVPPAVRSVIRPNVVFVAVPALPRGCLVEVQPLLLDVGYLDALSDAMVDGLEMSRTESTASDAPPAAAETATGSKDAFGTAAAEHLPADSAPAGSGTPDTPHKGADGAGGLNSNGAGHEGGGGVFKSASRLSPGGFNSLLANRQLGGSGLDITVDSCHTSVCSSLDLDGVAGCIPCSAGAAAPIAAAAGPASSKLGPGGGWQEAGCAAGPPAACCDNVMVTTVHCQQYGLLRSLYHLPSDVFSRPDVNKRLQHAVMGMLSNYNVPAADLMHIKGWYDVTQVSAESAQQLLDEVLEGWHVCWMPSLDVSTTACPCGTAAVLEVLAQVQG